MLIIIEFKGSKGWEVSKETPDPKAAITELKAIFEEGLDARMTYEHGQVIG